MPCSARQASTKHMLLEIIDVTVVGTVVAAGIFLGILVCLMLGRWLGRRAIARYGAAGVPNSARSRPRCSRSSAC